MAGHAALRDDAANVTVLGPLIGHISSKRPLPPGRIPAIRTRAITWTDYPLAYRQAWLPLAAVPATGSLAMSHLSVRPAMPAVAACGISHLGRREERWRIEAAAGHTRCPLG